MSHRLNDEFSWQLNREDRAAARLTLDTDAAVVRVERRRAVHLELRVSRCHPD